MCPVIGSLSISFSARRGKIADITIEEVTVFVETAVPIASLFMTAPARILAGVAACLIIWAIAIVIEKIILTLAKKSRIQRDVFYLLGRIVKMVLIVVGLIAGFGTMGIDVAAMVAGLGLTGFALGFALKDALSNVLAGVLVLVYQPFRIGSHIKVSGYDGTVRRVDLRYTTVESDNRTVLIPNANLFNSPVEIFKS